jgi:hypothetical protein
MIVNNLDKYIEDEKACQRRINKQNDETESEVRDVVKRRRGPLKAITRKAVTKGVSK